MVCGLHLLDCVWQFISDHTTCICPQKEQDASYTHPPEIGVHSRRHINDPSWFCLSWIEMIKRIVPDQQLAKCQEVSIEKRRKLVDWIFTRLPRIATQMQNFKDVPPIWASVFNLPHTSLLLNTSIHSTNANCMTTFWVLLCVPVCTLKKLPLMPWWVRTAEGRT